MLSLPPPGDLPDLGIEPMSHMSPALEGGFFTSSTTWEVLLYDGCSVAQLCLTLCNPMDCSLLGPLSMGFSRQEYWHGLPLPSPGDLPNPGIKPPWQADSLPLSHQRNLSLNLGSVSIDLPVFGITHRGNLCLVPFT